MQDWVRRAVEDLSWSTGKTRDIAAESSRLLGLLASKFNSQIIRSDLSLSDAVVEVERKNLLDIFGLLKLDIELSFNFLINVTAVDWLDNKPLRFEVVYHLLSTVHGHRLRVKVAVPEEDPEVDSLVSLFSGANFMEREVWDMFGIRFRGHPNLARVLLYEEFRGHALRKDYPVQGKQPRVPLRHPEVTNSARDMRRSELVSINSRRQG